MTVTELEATVALIVVDLQAGTAANAVAVPIDEVVAHTAQLLAAFRGRGLTVVLANVDGTPAGRNQYGSGAREFPAAWTAMLPQLDQQDTDLTLTRRTWSAFSGTDLDARLRERGVTQVVLAGLATSFGVESTARQAYDLGYSVVVAADAISDPNPDAHTASLTRVFPALGQSGPTDTIIGLLGEA